VRAVSHSTFIHSTILPSFALSFRRWGQPVVLFYGEGDSESLFGLGASRLQ